MFFLLVFFPSPSLFFLNSSTPSLTFSKIGSMFFFLDCFFTAFPHKILYFLEWIFYNYNKEIKNSDKERMILI